MYCRSKRPLVIVTASQLSVIVENSNVPEIIKLVWSNLVIVKVPEVV